MIHVGDHSGGLTLPVRAQPRAKKNAVVCEHDGALKVAVTAPPEDGRANEALVKVLAKALGVKRGQIALLTGATSREKTFLITNVERADLEQRLREML